jgi:hypothetical protein
MEEVTRGVLNCQLPSGLSSGSGGNIKGVEKVAAIKTIWITNFCSGRNQFMDTTIN